MNKKGQITRKQNLFTKVRGALFVLAFLIVLGPLSGHKAFATPGPGNTCSADIDNSVACYSDGCYVCTGGSWVQQALHIGDLDVSCTTTYAGMIRWNSNFFSDGGSLEFCDGSDWKDVTESASSLTGEILVWHTDTVPDGYLECNGAAVSRTTYASLFSLIGVSYGSGDGSTTFNIPNYKGYFLRGWTHGATANDPDYASRTDRGDGTTGNKVGTKQESSVIAHTHTADIASTTSSTAAAHTHPYKFNASNEFAITGSATTAGRDTTTDTSSSAGAHTHTLDIAQFNSASTGTEESRPPNISVKYIIKY